MIATETEIKSVSHDFKRSSLPSATEAMNSATFCVYPWIEQVVQPSGKMSFCCVARNGGILSNEGKDGFRAARDSLGDAWNSVEMRSIRKKMCLGERVDACETCDFQESIGKESYRRMHNREWIEKAGEEVLSRVEESLGSDFGLERKPPLYLDLRLGNICNLKCRSCNPYNSVQVHKETERLLDADSIFAKIWSEAYGESRPVSTPSDWTENDRFWDEITAYIPQLRKVYLTGGEPTLINKNYEFMQKCIDMGYAKRIFLMFNINGTNVTDRFLEYLPHFEFVLVNVSLDGFGALNEYIRTGSKWPKIDENFRRLLSARGNVQIGVTPVFQAYNVLDITRLLDYIDEMSAKFRRSINVDFLYATSPDFLDARILPPALKALAIERLENYKTRSARYAKGGFLKNSIDSALQMLRSTTEQHSAQKIRKLLDYTSSLDRSRQTDFRTSASELHELLSREGYDYV